LNALPCKATTEHYVEELAIYTHLVYSILLEEEDGRGIYLATDKADGSKVKKGCIKVLSKFCPSLANDEFPDGQLLIVVLDSDATGDDTEAVCKGIVKSIQKLPNGQVLVVVGTSSDSGGGGTVEKAKDNLVGKKVCDKYALVGNCTLHNMQLTGTVPMKHVFGAGWWRRDTKYRPALVPCVYGSVKSRATDDS
jgi:TusA-related sulfurtransferase